MSARTEKLANLFLVETCETPDAAGAWDFYQMTSDIEEAILAMAQLSVADKAPAARVRVGCIGVRGNVDFREALRMKAGGKFVPTDPTITKLIGMPVLGADVASTAGLDSPPRSGAAPQLKAPPRRKPDGHDRQTPVEPKGPRSIMRGLFAGALGSFAMAVFLLGLAVAIPEDQGGRTIARIDPPAEDREPVTADRTAVALSSQPPPAVLSAPESTDQAALSAARRNRQDWRVLFFGLDPNSEMEEVEARFSGCFQGADSSFYCEASPPSDYSDAAILVARFGPTPPHQLLDLYVQSHAFQGDNSTQLARAAFLRIADHLGRVLKSHELSQSESLPNTGTFWSSLVPGIGTGDFEHHWSPTNPDIAPYVRLRLVGQDDDSGYYLLQVSSPGTLAGTAGTSS